MVNRLWYWVIFGLVVFSDQLGKWVFETKAFNDGVAFGMGGGVLWEVVGVVVLLVIGWMTWVEKDDWIKCGLVILIAAGFSNWLDRILFGSVRDFIWWPFLGVYGNVADVWLVGGVGVVGWRYFCKQTSS